MAKHHGTHEISSAELKHRLDLTIGRTLGDIDSAHVLNGKQNNKGLAGAVFEQSVLGYPPDSYQKPDLSVDGVPTELKVTGLVQRGKSKREWVAKEPMSITAVSPENIIHEEFFKSAFWSKTEHLLIVYYLYVKPGKGVKLAQWATFEIKGWELHVWNEIDIKRLEADWTIVRNFVRYALATDKERLLPNLSTNINPLLLYLDTAPKYPNRPRFRLKRTLVNALAENCFKQRASDLKQIASMRDLDAKLGKFGARYAGMTLIEMAAAVDTDVSRKPNKALAETTLVKLLTGKSGKMNSVDLFVKASIEFKSIVLSPSGRKTEDMKLEPSIDFEELMDPEAEFEESAFGARFIDATVICAIFKEPYRSCPLSDTEFLGFKRFWLGEFEREASKLWNDMRSLIFEERLVDVPYTKKDGTQRTGYKTGIPSSAPNWPKSSDGILFVRGTGRDASDKTVEINGVRMYRQNVWVSGNAMAERLEGIDFLTN